MTDNQTKKDPFYIFTSISGVLYNYKSAECVHGPFLSQINYPILTKDNVDALNYLLTSLEQYYDTKLIITSKVRKDLPLCIDYLQRNGLQYDKPIFATLFKEGKRSDKIIEFMKSQNVNPNTKTTLADFATKLLNKAQSDRSFKNYLVIDKKNYSLSNRFPKSNYIATNPQTEGLTIEKVLDFLNQLNLNQESAAMQ